MNMALTTFIKKNAERRKATSFISYRKLFSSPSAFTLAELMVAMGILFVTIGVIAVFLKTSDTSWRIGQDKLIEQQEARRVIDDITRTVQYSNPNWIDSLGNNYPVTLSTNRIDFYMPRFYPACCPDNCSDQNLCMDADGNLHNPEDIASLIKVTYKLNPANMLQLLKKEGITAQQIIANNINSITFNCGCTGCSAVSATCPIVDITVVSQIVSPHTLRSKVTLKNQSMTLPGSVEIEEREQGEF